MNNKITFPKLAAMLADRSGRSKRFSEDFLREFFALISDTLEAGESVKIKGLGTFRLSKVEPRKSIDVTTGEPMEISGHTKVVFTPSKELAEAVNAPFESFSPIEISDGVDISLIDTADEQTDIADNTDNTDNTADHDDTEAASDIEIYDQLVLDTDNVDIDSEISDRSTEESYGTQNHSAENEDRNPYGDTFTDSSEDSDEEPILTSTEVIAKDETTDRSFKENSIAEDSDTDENIAENDFTEETDDSETHRELTRTNWRRGFFVGAAAAAVLLSIVFAGWYWYAKPDFSSMSADSKSNKTSQLSESDNTDENTIADISIANDSATDKKTTSPKESSAVGDNADAELSEVANTAPSDALVYDTIGKTRYLTTMAKSHYGNFNFWPYIYEENKSKLGHPDRIRPGTPVIIPSLVKYGVDPHNPKDIEKAKRLGIEIYAKYGKHI